MMKRLLALAAAALLLWAVLPAALAEEMTLEELLGIDMSKYPRTMYVRTDDGGRLNVRSEPKTGRNIIGRLEYGAKVTVEGPVVINADWSVIRYSKGQDGVGYVMTRYLASKKPRDIRQKTAEAEKRRQQNTEKKQQDEQRRKDLEELNKQLKTAKTVSQPFLIAVRPSRTSGWVNFRVGPGVAADRIASLPEGRQMMVIGETDKWYQAVDTETGKTGYISKSYVTVLGFPAQDAAPVKEQLGKLNVNGEFALQCQLPPGYTMQLINTMGTRISAFISPADQQKPVLQLSIAFNEMYADVDRMNDLNEEELMALEDTFTEMNDVDITYRETAYGTKLLIAREVGYDTDFVDILSVYKGYSIEFVMTPNPNASDRTLTESQIQMCIDFLSELDFVPAAS